MRKPDMTLAYITANGKHFEFVYDSRNTTDQRRILNTLQWAAKERVPVVIKPIQVEVTQETAA